MNIRLRYLLMLASAAALLAGCDQGRKAPPKVRVTIANIVPSYTQLTYHRERFGAQASLSFKGATSDTYDVDSYDFFADPPQLTSTAVTPLTFSATLEADNEYTFVLGEAGGQFRETTLVYPPVPSAATDAQIVGFNAADGMPAMDLYLTSPGAGIVGASPRATLAAQDQFGAQSLAAGDYELTLTVAGDQSTVLLHTTTLAFAAATSNVILIVPEAGEGTAELSVLWLQPGGSSFQLLDSNATSEVRVINAAADMQPRDVALNGEFSPPLFSSVPFAEPSGYSTAPVGASQPVNVTPAGMPGVIELDSTVTTAGGARYTMLVSGEAGTLTSAFAADSGRRVTGGARLRAYNAANQFTTGTEFVLVERGGDATTAGAITGLSSGGASGQILLPPGDYDLWLRESLTTTMRAGPIPITLAERGLYGVLATNGPDTATANVVLLDDFP
jgi:Domain of unknown function (DUF4397)